MQRISIPNYVYKYAYKSMQDVISLNRKSINGYDYTKVDTKGYDYTIKWLQRAMSIAPIDCKECAMQSLCYCAKDDHTAHPGGGGNL